MEEEKNIIEELWNVYNEKFGSIDESKYDEEKADTLRDLINGYYIDFFIGICKSVISGDYLINNYDVLASFKDLKYQNFKDLFYGKDKNHPVIQMRRMRKELSRVAGFYIDLIHRINNKVSLIDKKVILNAETDTESDVKNDLLKIVVKIIDILIAEHYASYDDNFIKGLIGFRYNLKSFKDSKYLETIKYKQQEIIDILNIVINKIEFLLVKFLKYSNKEDSFNYYLDYKDQKITEETYIQKNEEPYTSLDIYLDPTSERNREYIHSLLSNYQTDKANSLAFVMLMRYFKVQENPIKETDKLIKSFKEYLKKKKKAPVSLYDEYSAHTILNHLYNGKLVLEIKKDGINNFSDVEKFAGLIKKTQEETGIKDYYPWLCLLKKIVECVDDGIKKKEDKLVVKRDDIDKVNEYLKKCEECFIWCKEYYMSPFMLLYEDSCTIGENGIKIYTPSAFSKPISYNDVKDEIEKLKTDVLMLEPKLELYEKENEFLKEIKLVEEKIQKNDFKGVETLGVFTAVIAFIFSSSGLLTVLNSTIPLKDRINGILTFTFCLLLFVCCIYFIVVDKPIFGDRNSKGIFFLILTLLCCAILFSIHSCYV